MMWEQAAAVKIDKNNKAIKAIFNGHPRTPTETIYQNFNIVPLQKLIKMGRILFIHELVKNISRSTT